jgi:hypothetical protein
MEPPFERGFIMPAGFVSPTRPQFPFGEKGLLPVDRSVGAWSLAFLALTAAGLALWIRRGFAFASVAMLMAAQNLVILYLYNIADIKDYYLFPFWFGWVCIFVAMAWGFDRLASGISGGRVWRPEAAYGLLIVPALVAGLNWTRCNRRAGDSAEDVAGWLLPDSREALPENSIVLTAGDFDTFPAWYAQIVWKQRPDVLVFASNFIHRPWYRAFFTEEQIREYGLRFYGEVTRGAEGFVQYLMDGVISPNLGKRKIYTTIDDPAVLKGIAAHSRLLRVAELPLTEGSTMTLLAIEPPAADEETTR